MLCATWLLQCDFRCCRPQSTDFASQIGFASAVEGKPRCTFAGRNVGRGWHLLHKKRDGNAANADQSTDEMPTRSYVSQRGKHSFGWTHITVRLNSSSILNYNDFCSLPADITLELRALNVPWTLHVWMQSLAAAHEMQQDSIIDQLLQEFSHVCPNDYSSQFVNECLPLLFNIFRHSKVIIIYPTLLSFRLFITKECFSAIRWISRNFF